LPVKDIYFVYFLGALCGAAGLAYGVRVMTRGVVRNERVGRIGGTALVGQELMDWWYWSIEPIVRGLAALGITANGLTWSALVFGLGAGVDLGFGWFGLECLLATCSTVGDILDGQVARLTNTGSNRGELLDAAIDRYTEFAYLAGLACYWHDSLPKLGLVLAGVLACVMVSYASAKAEAMQVTPPRGLMRRHERAVYLIAAAGLTSFFGTETPEIVALAIVAAIGNAAAVQRLVRIAKALR
jgi:CDP-diacylglycerol--glycerol-3-phosphate 3-phosphatidyltransferase